MEDVEDRSIREVDDLPIPWCAYSSVPKVFLSLWVLQGVRPVGKTPVMAVVLVKMPVDSTQPTSGLSQSLIARTHCRGHGETILVDGDLHDIVPDETVGAAVPDHEMVLPCQIFRAISAPVVTTLLLPTPLTPFHCSFGGSQTSNRTDDRSEVVMFPLNRQNGPTSMATGMNDPTLV
jgi:hypothetical protein